MKFQGLRTCELCGQSKNDNTISHAKCSKILQRQYMAKNTKKTETVREFTPAVIDFITRSAS
jgi:hypothetical protein